MSELRPPGPALRPDTARPREEDDPPVDPPSPLELERVGQHLCALPAEMGATAARDPDLGVLMVRHPGAGPEANFAALPRWTDEGWRGSLERVARAMSSTGAWPSLLLTDRLDQPPELGAHLPSAGWAPARTESVLWVGRASKVPHLDTSLRLEAVQPRSVADHETLERRVFGLPSSAAEGRRVALADALATGRLRAYLVRLHDRPVAVARLSQGEGVAGLYAIGVEEEQRGKGLGRLVTAIATRAGLALGNRLVWLSVEDGNDAAQRLYAGLGFAPAFSWTRWMGPAR